MEKILLACDLDRTVLPNGAQPLSEGANEALYEFVSQPNVILAYLSGRDIGLINDALEEYGIPMPDIAIGDVGTTMYFKNDGSFNAHSGWGEEIGVDWAGKTGADIHELINHLEELQPQESEKQNTFKQSYYTPESVDKDSLVAEIKHILRSNGINATAIFSIDEQAKKGLIDILPKYATKKHALRYLQKYFNINFDNVIYAGDSGNDIEPLTSGFRSILVNNARDAIKQEVREIGEERGRIDQIYFASGGYKGMNGNYAAGILEGLANFGVIS